MSADHKQSKQSIQERTVGRLSKAGLELFPLVGKKPRDRGWRERMYSRAELLAHAETGGNVGVRLTPKQLILDIDPRNGGRESLERLRADIKRPLHSGPSVRTGRDGLHIYLAKPASIRVRTRMPQYPGIDFLSEGHLAVAPGSIHPETKRPYHLDDPLEEIGDPPHAPKALLDLIERHPAALPSDATVLLEPAELAAVLSSVDVRDYGNSGSYDSWLQFSMACHAVTGGLAETEWLSWCAEDPRHAGKETDNSYKWSGFDADRPDGVGMGTFRLHVEGYPDAADRLRAILAAKDFEALTPEEISRCEGEGNPVTALVDRINKRFCAVLEAGHFKIYMDDTDDAFDPPRRVWARMTREDFRHYHEDERVKLPDSTREVSVAEVWLKHPKRRKYSGIVMDPSGRADPDKLNLWQGWAVEPEPGDWSLLRSLIEETLCNGDGASAEYVKRWIAFMLQRPWESPETAVVFRGTEGTGKGTLGRALMRIAGPHGLTVSAPGQFAGRFNAHLRNCVFLFADEALWPGHKDAEGPLKQLVTEPVISYEGKGRDIVTGRNLVHLMMASNEKWVVPAGPDARRFAVFDVSDARRGDREFFGALLNQLDNGGLSGMVHDLMNLDLGGWHPSRDVPKTEALADQKLMSLNSAMKWWHEALGRGTLPLFLDDLSSKWEIEPVTLDRQARSDLVEDYDKFLKRNRIYSEKATHRPLVESGRKLGLETTPILRGAERAWVLPPLPEMRAAFERYVGTTSLFD